MCEGTAGAAPPQVDRLSQRQRLDGKDQAQSDKCSWQRRAAIVPMLTMSWLLPLVGMLWIEAEIARVRISATSAEAVLRSHKPAVQARSATGQERTQACIHRRVG